MEKELYIVYSTPEQFSSENKRKVARRCLEIAQSTSFPTNYRDIEAHLFGNDDATLTFLVDEKGMIYGFATFDKLEEVNALYLNGIILHSEIQSKGWSLYLLKSVILGSECDFLMLRTHNQRMYEAMRDVAGNDSLIFPHPNGNYAVPEEVRAVVDAHPATMEADEKLVVRGAYPEGQEIKSQKIDKEDAKALFTELRPLDAQVVVVRTKKPTIE